MKSGYQGNHRKNILGEVVAVAEEEGQIYVREIQEDRYSLHQLQGYICNRTEG